MKVTIKNVAEEAGVSKSTVSRVLSNDSRISDCTKRKVNEAIEKLNYKPNAIARSLANSKTKILGVIIPREVEDSFSNPFFIQAMKGMSICAGRRGYNLMYSFSEEEEGLVKKIEDFSSSKMIDGICLLSTSTDDKCINKLKKSNFPYVTVGRPDHAENALWVDNDNFRAMENVILNLIKLGHRKIGFVGAIKEMNVSKDRLGGYIQALLSNGIALNRDIIFEGEAFNIEEGFKMGSKILEDDEVTAIVGTDDLLAIGILEAVNKSGKKISVVGFNNIPMAKFQRPSLASVDIKGSDLGYYAIDLLIDKIEGEELKETFKIVDTEFIERESLN